MGYVQNTLAPGEKYNYRAHFNWTYDARSWSWFLLGAVPALMWVLAYGIKGEPPALSPAFYAFGGAAFVCGALIALARFIHRWTTVIAVTSVRLILKTGLIARKAHEVSLDKIEEVLVDQSFLGRLFGYGVLTVHGTGVAVIKFPVIGQPIEVRRKLETAIAEARKAARANGNGG